MNMWNLLAEVAARWGLPAAIVILPVAILYFWSKHNKQQGQLFREALAQQKEQAKQMTDMVQLMIHQQQEQAQHNFKQIERMLEQLQFLGGLVGRVENKIDTNQTCPVVRGELKPR
jgi:ATP-dependent 26S proteasome regulatory subunit